MSSAELSLRARVAGVRRPDVGAALWDERTLVKTWAMRGTLHLVAATELPELVRGLGTRLNWLTDVWLRYFKVTREEMLALQAAIGEVLSAEPMTRTELAEALAERLGDPAFAERVTSSWGTFLKPAAGRGYLAFGPERGRNVTFVHPGRLAGDRDPGARRGRDRPAHRPPPARVPRRHEGRAGPLVGCHGRQADEAPQAPRGPHRSRRPRGQQGLRARRGPRDAPTHTPGAGNDDPPPGRLRPVHAVAPEGGRAAAADGQAPARLADRGLDQRGRPVRAAPSRAPGRTS